MALTVKDILQLESLQGFRPVSGQKGLDRIVCSAGIADYEFSEGVEYHNEVPFEKESLVISSLLFAQNDSSKILKAVKQLYEAGTSAFAFKDVIYDKLPQEVMDFSDEKNYPVFSFGQNLYFENIIYEVMDAVQRDDTQILSEHHIKQMIENEMPREEVVRISKSISLLFKQYSRAVFISSRGQGRKLQRSRLMKNFYLHKTLKSKCMLSKYDRGLFILLTSPHDKEESFEIVLREVTESLGLAEEDVYMCRSGIYRPHKNLDTCLRESYHTCAASLASGKEYSHYHQIGAFKYLVPLKDSFVMNQYMERILQPIKDKEEFLETVKRFVLNNGDVTGTAIDCGCHQNTVRYRLAKVKELVGAADKTDFEFYAELSAAVRIFLLKKETE